MSAKCIFVHKNALCQSVADYFFLIVGMGGWISSVDFGYCMSAFCFIVKHLAVMNRFVVVFQMHDYVFQLSSVRRVVHPPPYHLKNYQVSNLPASCILDSYLVPYLDPLTGHICT